MNFDKLFLLACIVKRSETEACNCTYVVESLADIFLAAVLKLGSGYAGADLFNRLQGHDDKIFKVADQFLNSCIISFFSFARSLVPNLWLKYVQERFGIGCRG